MFSFVKNYMYKVIFNSWLQDVFADHPFIFMIREKTTGSILFMGRYMMPPASSGELRVVGTLKVIP